MHTFSSSDFPYIFNQNTNFIETIVHELLIKCPSQISPSEFLKEMSLSTEERMETLNNASKKALRKSKMNKIEMSPENVVFQNYGKCTSVSFAIINYTEVGVIKPMK